MAAQDQPHENLIFPEEVLPRGNALFNGTLALAGRDQETTGFAWLGRKCPTYQFIRLQIDQLAEHGDQSQGLDDGNDDSEEFLNMAEKQRKSVASVQNPSSSNSSNGIGSNSKEEGPRSAVAVQSEFNRRTSKIELGIH
ncbi:hypothetical protein RHMOL_Rhmol04G0000400 [Rhododendron molle]|uniref:Uncharacterized protein n=1 Tax=Rhododendron molle TaxID=49168 RepID=A0ACC0NVK0_RHOML|nr:hypothetical protein RHMOL_Rhmol04G0000400 [Rhododendron molle]